MKNKKVLIRIIVFMMLFLSFSVTYNSQCYAKTSKVAKYGYDKSGKWSYHILNAKKRTVEIRPATLDKAKKGVAKGTVKIPTTITINKKKYSVTKIAKCAFSVCICEECYGVGQTMAERWKDSAKYGNDNLLQSYHKTVTSLTIPASVTTIKDYAFGGQKNIKTITFASGSKCNHIGDYAFAYSKVGTIAIPNNVKKIGIGAFRECESLTNIVLSGSVLTEIGENAFIGSSITQLNIPASCKVIGNYAFADCPKLKTVTINATNDIEYEKTLFDGSSITTFYVKNHSIYSTLKNMFRDNTILLKAKVVSGQTLVRIVFGDTTKTTYVNRNQSIDYRKYCDFKEGRTAAMATLIPVIGFDGDTGKESELSGNGTYKATGYAEEYIYVKDKDISYIITNGTEYNFIQNEELHYTCKLKNLLENQYCYFDEITFAQLPTDGTHDKPGYTIAGYSINGMEYSPGETTYGFGQIDGQQLTCDFYYEPNLYTIKYDTNGGLTEGIDSINCIYGESYNLTNIVPTNNGLKFKGWCVNSDGTGTVYPRGAEIKNLATEDGAIVTLYAIWSDEPVNITLDMAGGTCTQLIMIIPCGQKYDTLPTPQKTGYSFKGWKIKDEENIEVTDEVLNCDHTLVAQWTKDMFNISFNANGGSILGSNEMHMFFGDKWNVTTSATKQGYKFLGWYTKAKGGSKLDENSVITSNMTVYAHWKLIKKNIVLTSKPKGIKKAKGYKIKCTVNGKKVHNKEIKIKDKKKIKKVIYTFKKVVIGDKLVMKVRCYKLVKRKNGKKKKNWYGWKTIKYTVRD